MEMIFDVNGSDLRCTNPGIRITRGRSWTLGSAANLSISHFCDGVKAASGKLSTRQYACHRPGLLSTTMWGCLSQAVTGSMGEPSRSTKSARTSVMLVALRPLRSVRFTVTKTPAPASFSSVSLAW